MSKIVCDVCGTSYADSATQCPICGCVRPGESVINGMDIQEEESPRSEGYTYVKGGRFSRSNVRKRNMAEPSEKETKHRSTPADSSDAEKMNDKGLIAAVCLLLLAIAAVIIYIVIHFFGTNSNTAPQQNNNLSAAATTSVTLTTDSASCSEIVLAQNQVELIAGDSHQLEVSTIPEDITDTIAFETSNSAVATVNENGTVQAVGAGEAIITITCGEASAEFKVVCSLPVETTEATQPSEPTQITEPTVPAETTQPSVVYVAPFRLNKHIKDKPTERDATIYVGNTFELVLLDANDREVPVEWSVEKTSVCSVDGNTIKGKKAGQTIVSTTYEDITYTCIVRVRSHS